MDQPQIDILKTVSSLALTKPLIPSYSHLPPQDGVVSCRRICKVDVGRTLDEG